jgi:hypothetical protein
MAKVEQVWSAQDFEAISIRAARCQVEIQDADEDQVRLEGDFEGREYSPGLDIEGRWLKIHRFSRGGNLNLILKLSKHKTWVLNIFAGQGDIRVKGIQSRLDIMLGHGDIQVEDYRGMLAISAGNADIQLKRFSQVEMPQEPPLAQGTRYKAADQFPWNWSHWEDSNWEEWGLDLGEKIAGWALNMGRFFRRTTINPRDAGVSIAIGQGDLQCEEITSRACLARSGKGDIRLKSGRISNLEIIASRGDVECASILPENDWYIRAVHGDVRLSLPANASARLDAATRHGDIQSEIPVVRVTRQGPETPHGKRMVGVIGSKAEGEVSELRISVMNGDIDLKSETAIYSTSVYTVSASDEPHSRTQLEVLQALSQRQISVDEADHLLRILKSRKEED